MTWEPELEELRRRQEFALQMGGPGGVERQRARGKLTVRERIDAFADPGSFREFRALVGDATYEDGVVSHVTPKPAVEGFVELDGRKVVVTAGDFTVRGGSGGGARRHGARAPREPARPRVRVPYVRLLDAAGGSVRSFEELGRTYVPDGNDGAMYDVQLLRASPVVSAVLGSVAGLPAVNACLSHFNVMVKGMSQLFPGGPPVVKAAPERRGRQPRGGRGGRVRHDPALPLLPPLKRLGARPAR